MTPYNHSQLSVRDFGGSENDYLPVHKFIDSTKFQFTDFRHRAILHNPFGIELCEKLFGDTVLNSNGINIPTREIARRHIQQDCSCVPTTKEWIDSIQNNTVIKFNKPNKKDIQWLKERNS